MNRLFALLILVVVPTLARSQSAHNPIIYADVPDLSMIRVGDNYYMSSTTMHMSPGVPIMKSKDLVNWQTVGYVYDILDKVDALDLDKGKNAYGSGSWASSLRYHNGMYYVSTFSATPRKTYIYCTKDIEHGPWKKMSFEPMLHDHSLFFDDDGKIYMVYGSGRITLVQLKDDLSGIRADIAPKVIIENASLPAGKEIGLPAEGSQLFKIHGKYYLFNITWPRGGMRTVVIHRADSISGPYEGRLALQDKGVAQGGLIETPDGRWFSYLFRDYGSVGRVPYMVPVKWEDGWPVLGIQHQAPDTIDGLPPVRSLDPGIVASDEFDRKPGDPALPLVWQWNHNPVNSHWSVAQHPGYLRLTTSRVDSSFLQVRNMLTQRTFGPQCAATTLIATDQLKEGDRAGLALLQKKFGWVGIQRSAAGDSIIMVNAGSDIPVTVASIPVSQHRIWLRADCDFTDKKDKARFFYSLDGNTWLPIGNELQMEYTLPHFMGYRYGLFIEATRTIGGYADFDFYHVGVPGKIM